MVNEKEVYLSAEMEKILASYPQEEQYALAMMQDIQHRYGYLPREALYLVARHLGVPISRLYSMATFYKAFSLVKKGRNIIRVCEGTACHIRSSKFIIDEIENCLGIRPGMTTEDGRFTLETVNCLGACALAPVMLVNGEYYGSLTPFKVREIISQLKGCASHEG